MLRPSAFSAFKTLLFALLLVSPLRGFETHQATNQDELFKLKGDPWGNYKMPLGDEVIVAEGDYICGPCYNVDTMYRLNSLNGTVRCATDDLGCKLSGEGSRTVMVVDRTAGGTLVLRSFSIHRGSAWRGGGLHMYGAAVVNLELTLFEDCQATCCEGYSDRGGGAVYASSGTLNLYGVSFLNNNAASNNGDDVYTDDAAVTVFSSCPDAYEGTPTEGESSTMPASSSPLPHQSV